MVKVKYDEQTEKLLQSQKNEAERRILREQQDKEFEQAKKLDSERVRKKQHAQRSTKENISIRNQKILLLESQLERELSESQNLNVNIKFNFSTGQSVIQGFSETMSTKYLCDFVEIWLFKNNNHIEAFSLNCKYPKITLRSEDEKHNSIAVLKIKDRAVFFVQDDNR